MLYGLVRAILFIYYCIFYRVKVTGRQHIPETGPVVLCSNHVSNHDPLLLGSFIKRSVSFIAKEELFQSGLSRFFLKAINAIETKRGMADMASYRSVMELLSGGGMLGIFVQGHRMKELDAKDAKSGAALYALKSGAAVVPVRISGNYRLFGKININIGEAIDLTEFKDKKLRQNTLREATDIIMERIASLG